MGEDKENKKKKKKSKKRKDEEGEGQAEQEKEEEKPKIDPTKFINSFSETVVEEVKPKLKLPTLIFNEKTVELAPREEVKPETEASEAKIDVQEEKNSVSIADSSKPQNLAAHSKKEQESPVERHSRHKESKVEGSRHEEAKMEVDKKVVE